MAARATMLPIIQFIRNYGHAALDDEFNGITYWTDEQIQDICDRASNFRVVTAKQVDLAGTIFRINVPNGYMVEADPVIYSVSSDTPITGTYNPLTSEITLATARRDGTIRVEGRFVSLWDALTDLWEQKAQQRFDYINVRAGVTTRIELEQEYNHCVQMAQYYRNKKVRRFERKWR